MVEDNTQGLHLYVVGAIAFGVTTNGVSLRARTSVWCHFSSAKVLFGVK